jgi:uncharacterized protein (UPF0305 family)
MKTMTLADELEAAQKLLQSYQDLAVEQEEDDAFVARGNGFCDRKYSEDFIEMQVAQITARVADLKKKIHDNNIQL